MRKSMPSFAAPVASEGAIGLRPSPRNASVTSCSGLSTASCIVRKSARALDGMAFFGRAIVHGYAGVCRQRRSACDRTIPPRRRSCLAHRPYPSVIRIVRDGRRATSDQRSVRLDQRPQLQIRRGRSSFIEPSSQRSAMFLPLSGGISSPLRFCAFNLAAICRKPDLP